MKASSPTPENKGEGLRLRKDLKIPHYPEFFKVTHDNHKGGDKKKYICKYIYIYNIHIELYKIYGCF